MKLMKSAYYDTKIRILALATAYYEGDDATRDQLRRKVDFFPISKSDDNHSGSRSLIIRVRGEIFLVEDTRGGETGVFSLLLPIM